MSIEARHGLLPRISGTLLLCLLAISAMAQEFVVRDLRVEGLQRIEEGSVYNYLPINIGDRLDGRRIQEAMRALYATGFFADVELRRDGETLVIAVLERPSIEDFSIEGNKDIKTEELSESLANVGLRPGGTFDRSVLEDVKGFLTDQYYSRGKYAVQVKTEVNDLPGNKVTIAIDIKEGKRARIRQINIVGNKSFSDDDILDDFLLKTPHFTSFYKQDDRYARESLVGDLETLRSFYMDRGFADFAISSTQVAISADKKDIYITVNIDEGDRYTISDIKLSGEMVVPEEQLRALVLIQPGQIFSQRLLSQSSEFMGLRLGQDGYAFAEVDAIPTLDEDNKEASVTFYVQPNNRVYVRRINFNGTHSINDEVFRREMRQLEGGWLSNRLVDRSKIRIQRLPYVESVEVETTPVAGTSDFVDVDFAIEEGLPGQFGGGVGFSESQGLILSGNFVHSNFLGTGNRIATEISSGRFRTIYSLAYTDPYRSQDGIARTISAAYRDITQFVSDASDFSTETLSAGIEYSYPITEFQRLQFGFSWQRAELFSNNRSTEQSQQWVLANGTPKVEDIGNGVTLFSTEFTTYELIAGWIFDSRNRALFANRGSRHRLSVNTTFPGSEVEYYVASYDMRKYVPLFGQWVFSLSARLAYGDDIGDTTAIPPYKHFFAGGPGTVRGFRESRLGPKDTFGNPYGGNLLTTASFELIVPTPAKWRASTRFSIFYDVGNVFSTGGVDFFDRLGDPVSYEFETDNLKHSVGIAAQWLAPLGIFRFSYSVPLNPFEGSVRFFEDETEEFQFSIGQAF